MSDLGDTFRAMKQEKQARRHKRLVRCLEHAETFRWWVAAKNLQLTLKNSKQHWIVQGTDLTIDWYPSSGKLVVNRQYKKTRQAYDVPTIKKIILELLKGEGLGNK